MPFKKKTHPKIKSKLHPRNKFRERYDLAKLNEQTPELSQYVRHNKYGDESIDFSNPEAVLALNKSLLKLYYRIDNWQIPKGYLCPPIPGRSDYIHYTADLLSASNKNNKIPRGDKIRCLDIGIGSNCVYPIIGHQDYGWSFVGTDIDKDAIDSTRWIVNSNESLKNHIEIRFQPNKNQIFAGVIKADEVFDLTICNPPFYESLEESQAETLRKLSNLSRSKVTQPVKNFGGNNNELWCEGGEVGLIRKLMIESKVYATSCLWFTTLISKDSHVERLLTNLEDLQPSEFKIIPMGQGNKISRILAWTFLDKKQQSAWVGARWR